MRPIKLPFARGSTEWETESFLKVLFFNIRFCHIVGMPLGYSKYCTYLIGSY